MKSPSLVSCVLPFLLLGCTGGDYSDVENLEVIDRARSVTASVASEHSLPFAVTLRTTGPEPRALLLEQLTHCEEARQRSAVDIYALVITIDAERKKPKLDVDDETHTLEIRLPAKGPSVSADEILVALNDDLEVGQGVNWHTSADPKLLRRALARDTQELAELEERLALEDSRLATLSASVRARAERQKEAVVLTPEEGRYARHTWFRACVALQRSLALVGRWRVLAADDHELSNHAAVLVLQGRWCWDAFAGSLLQTVVGGRSVGKLWRRDFWHRNPIYTFLDSEAPLMIDGEATIQLGGGSVTTLLDKQISGELDELREEVDERVVEPAGLSEPARRILRGVPALQQIAASRGLSGFRAWKELWDARLKNSATLPLYNVVSGVSRFLGHTRVSLRPPAVTAEQLRRLEELLQPGDILLVREDGFLSNAFLPGFWPHAILYLGSEKDWTRLRLKDGTPLAQDPLVLAALPSLRQPDEEGGERRTIEAVSKGVIFSSMIHCARKDYVLALRPQANEAERADAIRRAIALHGRPYDFDFNFQSDSKVVCTELVYRAYQHLLNFRVAIDALESSPERQVPGVVDVLGRQTMPANDLARYALYTLDHPKATGAYPGRAITPLCLIDRKEREAEFLVGDAAIERLKLTVER